MNNIILIQVKSLASKVILKLNNEANNSGDYARYVTPSGPHCIKFLINYK